MFVEEHVISGIQILSVRLIGNENWIIFLISFCYLSGLFPLSEMSGPLSFRSL